MQCMTCHEEVSQRFLHSIAANSCPFCGARIMPEEMQTALNKLREVMTDIEDKGFTEQAESWLRSNFDLIAITSVEYQTMQGALTDSRQVFLPPAMNLRR